MVKALEPVIDEFQQECAITRRMLERVPEEKLTWKPHAKSMSLGQLALHIATIPGSLSKLSQLQEFDAAQANFNPPDAGSKAEIMNTFNTGIKEAEACIHALGESDAAKKWCLKANGKDVFTTTRGGLLRSIMLNHWYHHRGQLSVYLRLLDVPVPVIYGRSADEHSF